MPTTSSTSGNSGGFVSGLSTIIGSVGEAFKNIWTATHAPRPLSPQQQVQSQALQYQYLSQSQSQKNTTMLFILGGGVLLLTGVVLFARR